MGLVPGSVVAHAARVPSGDAVLGVAARLAFAASPTRAKRPGAVAAALPLGLNQHVEEGGAYS